MRIFQRGVLHIVRAIFGAMANFLEEIFPLSESETQTSPVFSQEGYSFVRLVKQSAERGDPLVEEFIHPSGVPVMVKTLRHRFFTSGVVHMLQEARLLSQYENTDGQALLPELYGIFRGHHLTSVVMGIIPGVSISTVDGDIQRRALLQVVTSLRVATGKIGNLFSSATTIWQYIVAFPYYLVRVFFKRPKLWRLWALAAAAFFRNISPFHHVRYVITHYDLNPKNVHIMEDGQVGFFDFGRINLAPEEVELSLIGRHYWKAFQFDEYLEWLKNATPTECRRRALVAFASYHSVQIAAFSHLGSESEVGATEYLTFFLREVAPRLL